MGNSKGQKHIKDPIGKMIFPTGTVTRRYNGLACLQNNKVFFLFLPIIERLF